MEFNKVYNRDLFVKFLRVNFLPEDFVEQNDKVIFRTKTKYTQTAIKLGVCKSLDLVVYEIKHIGKEDPRVGLSKETFRLLADEWQSRALVLFVPQDNDANYRFSLITIDLKEGTKGQPIREYSNPRRCSYYLGEGIGGYTPNKYLLEKGRVVDSKDLQGRFSTEVLTKQFYNELFKWYQWAIDPKLGVTFPNNTSIEADDREQIDTKIIRLLTRLMFVWFIKQKDLIPNILFQTDDLKNILKDFDSQSMAFGNYYNAILQNLFFATLNRAIIDEEGKRAFAKGEGKDVKTLYRYSELFNISENEVIDLFASIPFLNGGLFECLDKTKTIDGVEKAYNYDGFSRNDKTFADGRYRNRAFIPNILFFEPEEGLFSILKRYNFTIEENTPQEQQVALDPELLGKVFENLLGVYNPETRETARNQSGSFYTPRDIVEYMVDESLIAYLGDTSLVHSIFSDDFRLDDLYLHEYQSISNRLKSIKILDPACGSGAFPMGLLNRIVSVLQKINESESIYQLKLNLIENCIYGVDIQSIATQISKLRFFISLICDCEKDMNKPNFGIPTLPNLETKFVSANSLIGLKRQTGQLSLINLEIDDKKEELRNVRHRHFQAKTANEKIQLRKLDDKIRTELANLLKNDDFYTPEEAEQLAQWNPYDQNVVSSFFDSEWMFGITDGFDIVIGNPPYISTKGITDQDKRKYELEFGFTDDTYNLFTFKGISILKTNGSLTYITPKTFWTTQTKRNMRDLILSKTIRYIFDTANPFQSAMVDTCITQVINSPFSPKNKIMFLDGSIDFKNPVVFSPIEQSVYCNTQNSVIFKPTEQNLKIWNIYGGKIKELYDKWWNKIKTSRDITENADELRKYRESLKPGDIALLGCLTEGGQGLATANNGKYIAIRKSTKWAKNIIESRPKKLTEAMLKYKFNNFEIDNLSPQEFLNTKTETEIAAKFDALKEKYGRDIFGQGYIYRLIDDNEMANVETLTNDEKDNGIETSKKYYVPYDKGDKDGNRWYLETPFAIAWSKENVHYLKTNSGKKGVGMPVLRNPQFYFKEGFCWNNILNPNARLLKVKLKGASVNDVGSMSLIPMCSIVNSLYCIASLNSNLIFDYYREFINCTVNIQINDLRQLPIIIPNENTVQTINKLANSAVEIKKSATINKCNDLKIVTDILKVEQLIDDEINKLYLI